jgi:hypothetical protein
VLNGVEFLEGTWHSFCYIKWHPIGEKTMPETQNETETYADVTVDWTFKRIFGQEDQKELLLFILNSYCLNLDSQD